VRWQEGNTAWVAHIGTRDGPAYKDLNRTVKDTFTKQMPQGITGFNPASAWDPAEVAPLQTKIKPLPRAEVFGLLTTSGDFYALSLGMLNVDPKSGKREWCVFGSKRVDPLDRDGLVTAFNRIN
jgi:hypothetical protein